MRYATYLIFIYLYECIYEDMFCEDVYILYTGYPPRVPRNHTRKQDTARYLSKQKNSIPFYISGISH